MKPTTCLLGLSLAAAAGVAPAAAQTNVVVLPQNPVKNACPDDPHHSQPIRVFLQMSPTVVLYNGETASISGTVTELLWGVRYYQPHKFTEFHPAATCIFTACKDSSILLSCGAPWPPQAVSFFKYPGTRSLRK